MLRLAGGVAAGMAGGGVLAASGGCRSTDRPASKTGAAANDVLVVELAAGELATFDAATGQAVVGAGPSVLSGDGTRLVRSAQAGSSTVLTSHRLPGGELVSSGTVTGQLAARATSPDGSLVALATPAGPGTGPYRPGARERTTIVVADSAGQRSRVELPGNLEPEAFDSSGQVLFVLDYLPPAAPDRYRVRAVDLPSGKLRPLLTRLKAVVPAGAEEEMRGEGRQAVYDPRTRQLFTLYTHQPDHLHTRDLIRGARAGAPHVHAFVHTLSLAEGWAFCIDLPAPFGEQPAAGHAIALSPRGDRLCVVDATSGALAVIDPVSLTVSTTSRFAPVEPAGPAAAVLRSDGTLLLGAGFAVVSLPPAGGPAKRWPTGSPVRGIAGTADGSQLYIGRNDAVLRVDAVTGEVRQRIDVPGLVSLRLLTAQP